MGNGISRFVSSGGPDSGCFAGKPGRNPVADPGSGGDSASIRLGTGKKDAVLTDAGKYLQFLMGALKFAIFPHARSPMFATSFGLANREMARGWITDQIKRNIMDPNWTQAPNLSKIAAIFARTMVLMGKCRFPLHLSKSKAENWFLICRLLNEQRMERNGRTFTSLDGLVSADCGTQPGESSPALFANPACGFHRG